MSLVLFRKEKFDTRLGIWKVEESIDNLIQRLQLNQKELEFYHSLNKGKRNLHWLASRVLLRTLLNTDQFIEVNEDEHGKPYLVNFDYNMSITHSYEYAAVILSKKRVGIDIEKIKPIISKVAVKFLHQEEFSHFSDINKEIEKLYVYWCTKESIFKLNGKRHLHFRENIRIRPFELKDKGVLQAEIINYDTNGVFSVHYERFDGYMFTYVIEE